MSSTNRSLVQRRAAQEAGYARKGSPPGWGGEALDAYLAGMSFRDISQVFGVNTSTARNAVLVEALYRVMARHAAEQVEDIRAELEG